MEASPISSGASLVFPTSTLDSLTSVSVSSYVGSDDADANICRNIDQMINCIRGGHHTIAARQWHKVQNEIDAMVQEIHIKAVVQHTLAWSYAIRLLAFADEITKLRLSPDKLFVVLRLHKVLNAEFFAISQQDPEDFSSTTYKLREAAIHMLCELKVLIQRRASRNMPKGGAVDEVTHYVMNYIRLLLHHHISVSAILAHNDGKDTSMDSLDHIVQNLITCLEYMLLRAAQAYGSGDLQCFFLMNNLHFTDIQMESLQLTELLGHSWVQEHKDLIDRYMETYVDLSWGPVVSCLSTRFSMLGCCFSHSSNSIKFRCQFDTTYFDQQHKKVEDPRLREVVRRAVCKRVIPAYQVHFERSRKVRRQYEWYTPKVLEAQLMEIFEGCTG